MHDDGSRFANPHAVFLTKKPVTSSIWSDLSKQLPTRLHTVCAAPSGRGVGPGLLGAKHKPCAGQTRDNFDENRGQSDPDLWRKSWSRQWANNQLKISYGRCSAVTSCGVCSSLAAAKTAAISAGDRRGNNTRRPIRALPPRRRVFR